MKVKPLYFLLCCTLLWSCKKLAEAPADACFIPYVDFVAYKVNPSTLTISFSSVTSYNGVIKTHQWDFGDGTTYTGEQPPPHVYPKQTSADTATYRIKYTVANDCGVAYWTHDITISPCLPNVKFTYQFLNDSTVQFTNQTTSASAVSYAWDFGDGTKNTSNETVITKTYRYDGNYKVVLKSTNDCGDNYDIAEVRICKKPVPVQAITLGSCASVNIDASATKNGALFQWDFGNGVKLPQTPSPTPNITYTYPKAGTYTITLSVTNKNGCDTVSTASQVSVKEGGTSVSNKWWFTANDLQFDFYHEPNAAGYAWNFGDGTTSSAQNPVKSFATPGMYTLTVTAIGSCESNVFTTTILVPQYIVLKNAPATGFVAVEAFSASAIYYLGANARLYKTDTSGHWLPISLPQNLRFDNNTHLFKDYRNRLWIYGNNEVALFNESSNGWTSYYKQTGNGKNKTITGMAVDKHGNLWTLTDGELRKNNKKIKGEGKSRFTALAYAANTDVIWVADASSSEVYYVETDDDDLEDVKLGGYSGVQQIKVAPNGDIYFSGKFGIIRTSNSGKILNTYTAQNTNGLLKGAPQQFNVSSTQNLWVIYGGELFKIPVNNSAGALNYSINNDLKNLSDLDLLIFNQNDTDIILAKNANNGAIQIK